MKTRKNLNRNYQKLVVWQDAKQLYIITSKLFTSHPYILKRIASNQIASVDSIQRNIAEGYCRKGIKEYLYFLYIAVSSLGESVSSMQVYLEAEQISFEDFEKWDQLAYKLENGLLKLIKSLQQKQQAGTWNDNFLIEEPFITYKNGIFTP